MSSIPATQDSRQNVETKVKVADLIPFRTRCQEIHAAFQWQCGQTDTYFRVASGRLKLREEEGRATLIAYSRPDVACARWSEYVLYHTQNARDLKHALSISPGILIVVHKQRELWLHAHTRIHLDNVSELGSFIELETVRTMQSQTDAEQEHHVLLQSLGISEYPPIPGSYSDLLLEAKAHR